MKKIVSSGKRMTTVNLDGTECEVVFSSSYNVFSVKAENTVTMALESGKSEGDDGVITVPAGESRMYPHMRGLKSVFITGSGKVEVFASNEAVNPFKSAPVNNGGYNANLLINPDFKINQRGLATYSGISAYSVDHWFRNSEATMNIAENGITLTYSGTSNPSVFQKIENTKLLLGKTLTFSACIDGAVYSCTNILPDAFSGTATYFAFARLDGSTSMPDNSVPHIRMQILTGLNLICVLNNVSGCEWAKLEIGSTATPYSPPDPATELIKCQRYYQIRSTNNIAAVDMRPNMREGADIKITALSDGNYSYAAEL